MRGSASCGVAGPEERGRPGGEAAQGCRLGVGEPGRVPAPARPVGGHGQSAGQRELEVLRLVAGGATNREVAAGLFITEATVKSHLLNIYGKLEVGDRAAAVTEAFHRGLLVPRVTP
ncbi:LuxR C-terminal-related transcriptional regulator [Lentzea sp. NPDC059081]|uniref:helix-turn-helix domain-containing protein n=1 Tax=Lentzea sp. NPDC059081 TaxID=3346719 RepID=UPI00367CC76B